MERKKKLRISPEFTFEEYENISKLAAKKNCSRSEIVRNYTLDGMKLDISNDNLDFMIEIVRRELRNTQQPEFDRLASLIAKTCVMAATSSFLTAETINRFVSVERQSEVKEVYNAARVKAIKYLKTNINDLE